MVEDVAANPGETQELGRDQSQSKRRDKTQELRLQDITKDSTNVLVLEEKQGRTGFGTDGVMLTDTREEAQLLRASLLPT